MLVKTKKLFWNLSRKAENFSTFIDPFFRMKKVRLEILGLHYSQSQSGAYALVLGVVGENQKLPIIIGGYEAQSIAVELEKMKPTRPLTHDLFKSFASHFNISIVEVVINKFENGIFYSKLVCKTEGHTTEIDSRTSDAIALAIRFSCPIYCYESIISEAGITMDEEGKTKVKDKKSKATGKGDLNLEDYLSEELKEMLDKAIAEENFEMASRLRDEINRRKKNID